MNSSWFGWMVFHLGVPRFRPWGLKKWLMAVSWWNRTPLSVTVVFVLIFYVNKKQTSQKEHFSRHFDWCNLMPEFNINWLDTVMAFSWVFPSWNLEGLGFVVAAFIVNFSFVWRKMNVFQLSLSCVSLYVENWYDFAKGSFSRSRWFLWKLEWVLVFKSRDLLNTRLGYLSKWGAELLPVGPRSKNS